jgi:hypothetical protein
MINQLHQSIGGVVANDLLPDEFQLRGLIKQAGLKINHFEDSPQRYLVIAEKSAIKWSYATRTIPILLH